MPAQDRSLTVRREVLPVLALLTIFSYRLRDQCVLEEEIGRLTLSLRIVIEGEW